MIKGRQAFAEEKEKRYARAIQERMAADPTFNPNQYYGLSPSAFPPIEEKKAEVDDMARLAEIFELLGDEYNPYQEVPVARYGGQYQDDELARALSASLVEAPRMRQASPTQYDDELARALSASERDLSEQQALQRAEELSLLEGHSEMITLPTIGQREM